MVSWREEWGDRKEAEARSCWAHRPQYRVRNLCIRGGTWECTNMTWFTFLRDGSDCLDEECMLKIKSEIGRIVYLYYVWGTLYIFSLVLPHFKSDLIMSILWTKKWRLEKIREHIQGHGTELEPKTIWLHCKRSSYVACGFTKMVDHPGLIKFSDYHCILKCKILEP